MPPMTLSTSQPNPPPHASLASSPTLKLTDLPAEVLGPILGHLLRSVDLISFACTCKSLCLSAHISLLSRPVRILTLPRLQRFLSSLVAWSNPHTHPEFAAAALGQCVRHLDMVFEMQDLSHDLLAQLGTLCPKIKHLMIHDAVCVPEDIIYHDDDDFSNREIFDFCDGDYGFFETKTSGPNATRHLSSLFALTARLESLNVKQIKSVDIVQLFDILASSCPRLDTLTIAEMDNRWQTLGPDNPWIKGSPTALRAVQSLSTLSSLRTLNLDDVCSRHASAVIVQHLDCPSLTALSLCNNYDRRDTDFRLAFTGLLKRHPELLKLRVQDSCFDGESVGYEAALAALEVWPVEAAKSETRTLIVGYVPEQLTQQFKRKFGNRVVIR